MPVTTYSHAFLVGSISSEFRPWRLDQKNWTREIINPNGNGRYAEDRGYNGLCTLMYKAHVDAMLEADSTVQHRPQFLDAVSHYYHDIPDGKQMLTFEKITNEQNYTVKLLRLHIFTFPLGINLFAIEIDDSEQELNALTMGHFVLSRWAWNWDWNFSPDIKKFLNDTLSPLKDITPGESLGNLISGGNKLKVFQAIQLDMDEPDDRMLYEIGSFSEIGCIDDKDNPNSPSKDYWETIVKNNAVSNFRNWKGLALLDSFTVLGAKNSFNIDDFNFVYFPLIYLRCVMEKMFCFSRNVLYREDRDNIRLSEELNLMEKFYFYDNISHNFQPNTLYRAMARGLGLEEERAELSVQIKEQAREEEKRTKERKEILEKKRLEEEDRRKEIENKRLNRILAWVAVFAIISVVWDLFSIITKAVPCMNDYESIIAGICLVLAIVSTILVIMKINRYSNLNDNILPEIRISEKTKKHLEAHFSPGTIGSKFTIATPEDLINQAKSLFPDKFKRAVPDIDGRIRLSFVFPNDIGYCNVISISELTQEEQQKVKIVERQRKRVYVFETNRTIPTKECQMVFSSDWNLITMFPGEMAPPLSESSDVYDEYWFNHVFIEPINQ